MSEHTLGQLAIITDSAPIARVSCLAALHERRPDVVCFTYALLITHGRLHLDPLRDFVARFNVQTDQQPFCVALSPDSPPFFAGIPITTHEGQRIDWNRRIYAIPKIMSEDCFNFLGAIGIAGPDNFFARSVQYQLRVPDPFAITLDSVIPTTVFGVLHNDYIAHLAPTRGYPPFVTTVHRNETHGLSHIKPAPSVDLGAVFRELKGDK